MNITVFDVVFTFPRKAKVVTPETENFLHFLLEDEYFQNEQKELRQKYGIPVNGYSLDVLYNSVEVQENMIEGLPVEKVAEFNRIMDQIFSSEQTIINEEKGEITTLQKYRDEYGVFFRSLTMDEQKALRRHQNRIKSVSLPSFDDDKEWFAFLDEMRERESKGFSLHKLERRMKKDLQNLTAHYQLDSSFITQFFLLIAFNAFLNIKREPFFYFTDIKEDLLHEVSNMKQPFAALLFYEQVSKRQLINWIDENWDFMAGLLKNLPKTPSDKSSLLILGKAIYELREHRKMQYKEIAEYLMDKYPEDDRVSYEAWVKETYNRYKKKLQTFTKKT